MEGLLGPGDAAPPSSPTVRGGPPGSLVSLLGRYLTLRRAVENPQEPAADLLHEIASLRTAAAEGGRQLLAMLAADLQAHLLDYRQEWVSLREVLTWVSGFKATTRNAEAMRSAVLTRWLAAGEWDLASTAADACVEFARNCSGGLQELLTNRALVVGYLDGSLESEPKRSLVTRLLASEFGDSGQTFKILSNLVSWKIEIGELEAAESMLEEIDRRWSRGLSEKEMVTLSVIRAEFEYEADRLEACQAALDEARAFIGSSVRSAYWISLLGTQGLLDLKCGRISAARLTLDQLGAYKPAEMKSSDGARALELECRLTWLSDQSTAARMASEYSMQEFAVPFRLRLLYLAAHFWVRLGDEERASDLIQEGCSLTSKLALGRWANRFASLGSI